MSDFKVYKEISTVPSNISSDAMYAVRTGPGFDLYLSDTTGSVVYKINNATVSNEDNNIILNTPEGLVAKVPEASDVTTFITLFEAALNG